jgi:hydrogenase maturation factor HypF (carbamoyltransferase family)
MNLNKKPNKENTFLIETKGLVQGVGFRPFIHRLTLNNNLKGCV